ncbi:proteoglycan 4-like [Lepisosteus oculatus]|uniref:proteoglycan 4-like n=1 Tax=Lepisosteus oculatus TaxID=7918 RepID=UPI0035F50690
MGQCQSDPRGPQAWKARGPPVTPPGDHECAWKKRKKRRRPGNKKKNCFASFFLHIMALCVCCGGVTPGPNSKTRNRKEKTTATPATSCSTDSDVKTPPSPLSVSNKQAEPTGIQPNNSSGPTPVTDPVSAGHKDPEKGHTTPVEQFPRPVSPEAPRANDRPPTTKWADVSVKKPIRPVTAPPPTIEPFKMLPTQPLPLVGNDIPAPGLIGLSVLRNGNRPKSEPLQLQDTGPSAKIDWQLPGVPIPSPSSWQEDGEEDELHVSQESFSSTDSSEEGSYILWAEVGSEETEL